MLHSDTTSTVTSNTTADILVCDIVDGPNPNEILLFGRTMEMPSVSCAIVVQNCCATIYVTTRDHHESMKVVKQEVLGRLAEVHPRAKIELCKSRRRNYAFNDHSIHHGSSSMLKIRYTTPCESMSMPLKKQQLHLLDHFRECIGKTYGTVLAPYASLSEYFVLKKRIRGPCVVRCVMGALGPRRTCCAKEVWCMQPRDIVVVGTADNDMLLSNIVVIGIHVDIEWNAADCVVGGTPVVRGWSIGRNNNNNNNNNNNDDDSSAGTACCTSAVVRLHHGADRRNEEKRILVRLASMISSIDPDVIVWGPDTEVQQRVVASRAMALGLTNIIGRIINGRGAAISKGRIHCDIAKTYQDTHRKCARSCDIEEMCMVCGVGQMKERTPPPPPPPLVEEYGKVLLALERKLDAIALPLELSRISGLPWGESTNMHDSHYACSSLLFAFHKRKFVCPVATSSSCTGDSGSGNVGGRRKPRYQGGLNIEPKRGMLDEQTYALVDFKSLYPSIIAEYDICFTTCSPHDGDNNNNNNNKTTSKNEWNGILPRVVWKLVQRRKAVRVLMQQHNEYSSTLTTKQLALKRMANSVYGFLGKEHGRFYAPDIAARITRHGRESLSEVVSEVQQRLGLSVVYGDTDSALVGLGKVYCTQQDAARAAQDVADNVFRGRRYMELAVEGIYRAVLIMAKKKYAAWHLAPSNQPTVVTRGFEMDRRDWCRLCSEGCTSVLTAIGTGMRGRALEEVAAKIINETEAVLKNGTSVALADITVTTTLRPDTLMRLDNARRTAQPNIDIKKDPPHVTAALNDAAARLPPPLCGRISYVMLSNGGNCSLSQCSVSVRSCSLGASKRRPPLLSYYVERQLRAPIQRLLKTIDVTLKTAPSITDDNNAIGWRKFPPIVTRSLQYYCLPHVHIIVICTSCGSKTDAAIITCGACGVPCVTETRVRELEEMLPMVHGDGIKCMRCNFTAVDPTGEMHNASCCLSCGSGKDSIMKTHLEIDIAAQYLYIHYLISTTFRQPDSTSTTTEDMSILNVSRLLSPSS